MLFNQLLMDVVKKYPGGHLNKGYVFFKPRMVIS